ncbi:hypothetical protein MWH03_00370 [Klebsiella pneumoniae]|nr:hypothetical protein [Klebsiella pneumoniae]
MSTAMRQRIEKEIAAAAINGLLAAGYHIAVFDGESVALKASVDKDAILKAMFTTDEDVFHIYTADGTRAGFVHFVYGNDGWDVICDYTLSLEAALVEADKLADTYS